MKKLTITILLSILLVLPTFVYSNISVDKIEVVDSDYILCYAKYYKPVIEPYEVCVTNPNGIHFYEESKIGFDIDGVSYGRDYFATFTVGRTLPTGRTLTIKHEMISTDGEIYGLYDQSHFVRLSDVTKINKEEKHIVDYTMPKELIVLAEDGVKLYSGPSLSYKVTGTIIPKDTELIGYPELLSESSNIPRSEKWFYVEYNGINGWINKIEGVGPAEEEELIVMEKIAEYLNQYNLENSQSIFDTNNYEPANQVILDTENSISTLFIIIAISSLICIIAIVIIVYRKKK